MVFLKTLGDPYMKLHISIHEVVCCTWSEEVGFWIASFLSKALS